MKASSLTLAKSKLSRNKNYEAFFFLIWTNFRIIFLFWIFYCRLILLNLKLLLDRV